MSRQKIQHLLGLLLLSAVWFVIGWSLRGQLAPAQPTLAPAVQRMILAGQLIVDRYYPGPTLTAADLANAAIRGMLYLTQDRYVALLTGPVSARFEEDFAGETGAPGLWYTLEQGKFVITALRADGPAVKAGVQVGDVLLAVDGRQIDAFTTGEELAMALRGPLDTPVAITVQRGEQTLDLSVGRIPREPITSRLLQEHIGYVKLPAFLANSGEEMKSVLHGLQAQGMESLIWDLRGNAGGSMRAATTLLEDLIAEGVFYTAQFKDGRRQSFSAKGGATLADLPLVILTDGGTFSAAEMVTAALQDHGRALVIGSTTGGKGVLQDTIPLDADSRLHLTIAQWFSPAGRTIHQQGIQPDVPVVDDPATPDDEVVAVAVEQLQAP